MFGLRQYWWCLIVPVLLVAGALSMLSPGGIPNAATAPYAPRGGLSLHPSQAEVAGGGQVATSVQAQESAHPAATPSSPARGAAKPTRPVRMAAGPDVSTPPAGPHLEPVAVTPVSYAVALSQDALLPGSAYTVRGFSYTSPGAREVALLLHGFGFSQREWDLPGASPDPQNPYTYSTARFLAAHGIDAITIDELGIGSSDHPAFLNARLLTIPAYASMTHQIVQSLHARYQKVVLVGGSSGGEIANVEAGRYRDVDGLVNAGFCDLPLFSADLLAKNLGPLISGLVQPYVYFGGTIEGGDRLNFSPEADPAVVAMDDRFVEQVPSAYAHTLTLQLGKAFVPLVNVPVLVAFGQQDAAWLPACQTAQAALYLSSPSVSTFVLPGAGHALMLHRNAGAFESELVRWLKVL